MLRKRTSGISLLDSVLRKRTHICDERTNGDGVVPEGHHLSSPGSLGCSVSPPGQHHDNCAVDCAADGAQLHPEQQANTPSARSTTSLRVPPPVERGAFYARSESSKQILALRSRQVQQLAIFPLQQQAIDYADNHSDLAFRVFSFEHPGDGRRAFMAATLPAFWEHYWGTEARSRHYYEIIREDSPCHLYLDLEYSVEANPAADGEAMLRMLLHVVELTFEELWGIHMCGSWVLELESSTPQKFSRHVVVKVPGCAFRNNRHVGAFVHAVCNRIHKLAEHCSCYQQLFVAKAGGGVAMFVDTGVYTRNRAFRLYLSSKAGKSARLLPHRRSPLRGMSPKDVLWSTLIVPDMGGCAVPGGPPHAHQQPAWPSKRAQRLSLLSVDGAVELRAASNATGALDASMQPADNLAAAPPQYGPVPYKGLQAFIESQCTKGGAQGRVRTWTVLGTDSKKVIALNIKGNRWCDNIGRAHKSNGIFYMVDISLGVWYQRCHDPDCRDFRSDYAELPDTILAACRAATGVGEGSAAAAGEHCEPPANALPPAGCCSLGLSGQLAAGSAGSTGQAVGSDAGRDASNPEMDRMLCEWADELEYDYYCLKAVEAAEATHRCNHSVA